MKILIFTLFLISFTSTAQAQQVAPVVAELFSSQSCPACPPADEYIKTLAKTKGVIALSCHVDYFPVMGASLGKEFCTDRQAKYIKQMGRKKYYTPQMMINGHVNVIGYETEIISTEIQKARSEKIGAISIQPQNAGVYNFSLPRKNFSGSADLWMMVYDKPRSFKTRGQMVTYYNVVSHLFPLGQWKGGEIHRAVFPITNSKSAGFAIVAQSSRTGKVLAAGDYRF